MVAAFAAKAQAAMTTAAQTPLQIAQQFEAAVTGAEQQTGTTLPAAQQNVVTQTIQQATGSITQMQNLLAALGGKTF